MSALNTIRRPFPYKNYNITLALIITNVGVYLLTLISDDLFNLLALYPKDVKEHGYIWQVFTYMFVHAKGAPGLSINFTHILLNMLALYMFGKMVESRLGSIEYLVYYLVCGTATGIVLYLFGNPTVGASGAVYAVLLAFATLFPDARLLFFFVIPMRAPMAVILFAAISLFALFTDNATNISHIGHLGGFVFGFLYLVIRLNINPIRVFFPGNRRRY